MDDPPRTAAEALSQLHQEDPWFAYPEAVDLLSGLPAGEVPALAAALDEPSAKIRAAVARALGAYRLPSARAALGRALADADPTVRRAAIGALASWPDAPTIAALGQVAAADHDLYTRLAAIQTLGTLGTAAMAPLAALLTGAETADPLLLGQAAEALAAADPVAARDPLIALLAHPEAAVREAALAALTPIAGRAEAPAVRAYAAREPDPYLAAQAHALAARLA